MILPSTLRKCAARGEKVYLIRTPAWTMKRGCLTALAPHVSPAQDTLVTQWEELFTSDSRARRRAFEVSELNDSMGGPNVEIYTVPAADIDPWTAKLTSEDRLRRIN